MQRPAILATDHQRRYALFPQHHHGVFKILPGLDRLRINSRLFCQGSVCPDTHHRGVERRAIDAIIEGEGAHCRFWVDILPAIAHRLAQVADKPRIHLIAQPLTAPGVIDIRALAGLQHGGQARFVRLVGKVFELDINVGVLRLIGGNHFLVVAFFSATAFNP